MALIGSGAVFVYAPERGMMSETMFSTPIIKSTNDEFIIAPFLSNMMHRILESTILFINYEEDGCPFITNVEGRIPSRESFRDFVERIQAWYDAYSDDNIWLYNQLMILEDLVCTDPKLVDDKDQRPGYIYIIKAEMGQYKIGRTKNIPNRMNFFGIKLPFNFELILTIPVIDMYKAESLIHELCADIKVNGEWFNLDRRLNYLIDRFSEYDSFGTHQRVAMETS